MSKALILESIEGDWEQLWIDGELYSEGHTVELGVPRYEFWLNLYNTFKLKPEQLQRQELNDEDERIAQDTGRFPEDISKYITW